MGPSNVKAFEDRRWTGRDQELVWRHETALKLVMDEPVLDIGGGDGFFLVLLRERRNVVRMSLLDISSVAVEKARSKGVDARVGDITEPLPYPDGFFGSACALDVLEHLYDPVAALREMGRVARWAVVIVPNFHYWKERLQMLTGRVPFQCKPKRGHVHWFNYSMLQEVIAEAGLEVDIIIFGGFRRFSPVGSLLARFCPNLFAHSFAVRLKKK